MNKNAKIRNPGSRPIQVAAANLLAKMSVIKKSSGAISAKKTLLRLHPQPPPAHKQVFEEPLPPACKPAAASAATFLKKIHKTEPEKRPKSGSSQPMQKITAHATSPPPKQPPYKPALPQRSVQTVPALKTGNNASSNSQSSVLTSRSNNGGEKMSLVNFIFIIYRSLIQIVYLQSLFQMYVVYSHKIR